MIEKFDRYMDVPLVIEGEYSIGDDFQVGPVWYKIVNIEDSPEEINPFAVLVRLYLVENK